MRTLSSSPQILVSRALTDSAPSVDIPLNQPVRPQSIEVFINGIRIARDLLMYDPHTQVVTVPWVLFAGDTVFLRATPTSA